MGFFLRKTVNLGGIRLNLSNSGIGFSTGVKGFRVGIDGKGRGYIGGGVGMLRFRQGLGSVTQQEETFLPSYTFPADTVPEELKRMSGWTIFWLIICTPVLLLFWSLSVSLLFNKHVELALGFLILSVPFLIPYFSIMPQDRFKYFKLAKKAYNNNDFNTALNYYEKTYSCVNSTACMNWLVSKMWDCCEMLNDDNKKLDFLNTACAIARLSNRREKIIACYYNLKKFEDLISFLQKEYTESEKEANPAYYVLLAQAFLETGNEGAALESMLSGPVAKRTMNDDMCDFRYQLGLCYEANGDIKNALKQYQKVYAYDVDYEDVAKKIEDLKN